MTAARWPIDVSGAPCMLQDQLLSSYAGYLSVEDVVAFLRELEREVRADVRVLAELRRQRSPGPTDALAADLRRRRLHQWLMLRRHRRRLARRSLASKDDRRPPTCVPLRETSLECMAERDEAMDDHVEKILAQIGDDGLHADLKRLRQQLQEDARRLRRLPQ